MARPAVKAPSPVPVDTEVNHPSHYQAKDGSGIECIQAIRAQLGVEGYLAYLRGTLLAYNWRAPHKERELVDSKKAAWYMDEIVRVLEEIGA